MAHWVDLTSAIRSTGQFERATIMGLALARARRERDAFAAMGLPQPWAVLFAHELRLVWQVAKTAMDTVIAARLSEAMAPAERAARALELRAEVALAAIPPRASEAADLRAQAAAVRASGSGVAAVIADTATDTTLMQGATPDRAAA